MRSRFIGAVVGTLLLAGCGAQSCGASPQNLAAGHVRCSDPKAVHHAYVVVQHMSGAWIQACVGFGAEFIDGQTLMDRSGIAYTAQPAGDARVVCQVDGEPLSGDGCPTAGHPSWALFTQAAGTWSRAGSDFAGLRLYDTQAMGWRFIRAGDASPAPPPHPRLLGS